MAFWHIFFFFSKIALASRREHYFYTLPSPSSPSFPPLLEVPKNAGFSPLLSMAVSWTPLLLPLRPLLGLSSVSLGLLGPLCAILGPAGPLAICFIRFMLGFHSPSSTDIIEFSECIRLVSQDQTDAPAFCFFFFYIHELIF